MGITCLLASHDPMDTLSWADQIIVVRDGAILQVGAPKEIYRRPVNEYVAGLFGNYQVMPPRLAAGWCNEVMPNIEDKQVLIRPEDIIISKFASVDTHHGVVKAIHFMGGYYEVEVAMGGFLIQAATMTNGLALEDAVFVSIGPPAMWYL